MNDRTCGIGIQTSGFYTTVIPPHRVISTAAGGATYVRVRHFLGLAKRCVVGKIAPPFLCGAAAYERVCGRSHRHYRTRTTE